jgi:nucleotide-binding universal stress UspA family protein
MVNNSRL